MGLPARGGAGSPIFVGSRCLGVKPQYAASCLGLDT